MAYGEYQSFAGCDIVATVHIPFITESAVVIANLQTISYSTHREVHPVRKLGMIYPAGFTRGPATIAGSLIFTIINKSIVHTLMTQVQAAFAAARQRSVRREPLSEQDKQVLAFVNRANYIRSGAPIDLSDQKMQFYDWKTMESFSTMMNEMPPFDITITLQNEYGYASRMVLKGIVIVDEGQVMSIEDILTEQTFSFMATDIESMRPLGIWDFTEGGLQISEFNKEIAAPGSLEVSNLIGELQLDTESAILDVGNTLTINAQIGDTNEPTPEPITWKTTDTDYISVIDLDRDGRSVTIEAVGYGPATITASIYLQQVQCKIYVQQLIPTSISLPESDTIQVLGSTTLTVTFDPENATDQSITWSSSDDLVATVVSSGIVYGVSTGVVEITARSTNYPKIKDT